MKKIKKQIKEKYKLCNLYVKNLPDSFDDESLKRLFEPFGEIRSCKTTRKELLTSYLGIRRSVKVFGYVCFADKSSAHEAKKALHDKPLNNTNNKLYVDYHQSKSERTEFLKLNMINKSSKVFQRGGKMEMNAFPGMLPRNFPHMRQFPGNVVGPHMLRKFPAQTQFVKPPMMNQEFIGSEIDMMNAHMGNPEIDANFKRDYYGERLYSKISSKSDYAHMSEMFSRIVGIFLDLEEPVIERLIKDDAYFDFQVKETLRLLAEKGSH